MATYGGNDETNAVSGSREGERPLVVAVEGNLGSGKTTFLNYCAGKSGIDVYPEPIEKWRNINGENLLAKFYAEPRRWGALFQMQVGMTILDNYKAHSWKPLKLMERSLLSSRFCFLENMKRTGVLQPVEYHVLEGWYERVQTDWLAKPHAIVYLQTTPTMAYERVVRRARAEEGAVSMAYMNNLHLLHEEWLGREQAANMAGEQDLPIYIINADRPINEVYHQYETCLHYLDLLNA